MGPGEEGSHLGVGEGLKRPQEWARRKEGGGVRVGAEARRGHSRWREKGRKYIEGTGCHSNHTHGLDE